jgi:hypothetical protein
MWICDALKALKESDQDTERCRISMEFITLKLFTSLLKSLICAAIPAWDM